MGSACSQAQPSSGLSSQWALERGTSSYQTAPNACSPNLRGLANQPRDQRPAMSRPRAPGACSKVNTRAVQAGEQGSFSVSASETPCVHYSKQAPAHEALLARLQTDGAAGCSVAPGSEHGKGSASLRLGGVPVLLGAQVWSGLALCGSTSRLPASGVSAGEGNVSFHRICPCLHSLSPWAAWERGGLCRPQRPPRFWSWQHQANVLIIKGIRALHGSRLSTASSSHLE